MANLVSGVNVKDLEGRPEGENRPTVVAREFFWDYLSIFLLGVIIALSAIDFLFEWIRGSQVQCFYDKSDLLDKDGNVNSYITDRCSSLVPLAGYLPGVIALHAILVLAPHYMWNNMYGSKSDSFFHLASSLTRTRDPLTGDFPDENYIIFKQMNRCTIGSFYSNGMFYLYLVKLGLQVAISLGGLGIVAGIFRDFDETFLCPGNGTDIVAGEEWPLVEGANAQCIFTSLRLLRLIWFVYFILLGVAILSLILAFLRLGSTHPNILAPEKVVKFSFQTCLPFHAYKHPLALFPFRNLHLPDIVYGIISVLPTFSVGGNRSYHIQSDYDFLLVKLYRTDRGLANVLREVHMQQLLKSENELELARISINKIANDCELVGEERAGLLSSLKEEGLGWTDIKKGNDHHQVTDKAVVMPNTVRGVVLGLSARSTPNNNYLSGALCIVFDSESLGFAGALARAFERVALLNFSQHYADYQTPARIDVNNFSSRVLSMTVPHDIMTAEKLIDPYRAPDGTVVKQVSACNIFFDDYVNEIWQPNWLYQRKKIRMGQAPGESISDLDDDFQTDFILVGPLSSESQRATVNMFLHINSADLSPNAVLLTITPLEISGVKVSSKDFFTFKPFGYKEFKHGIRKPDRVREGATFNWPPQTKTSTTQSFVEDLTLTAGETCSTFRFHLYERITNSSPAAVVVAATQSASEESGQASQAGGASSSSSQGQLPVAADKQKLISDGDDNTTDDGGD